MSSAECIAENVIAPEHRVAVLKLYRSKQPLWLFGAFGGALVLVAFQSIAVGFILDTVTRGRRELKLLAYRVLLAPGQTRRS
jgi:hypothetical protein